MYAIRRLNADGEKEKDLESMLIVTKQNISLED